MLRNWAGSTLRKHGFYRNLGYQVAQMVPGMPKIIQRSLVSLIDKLVVKPGIRDWRLMPPRDRELIRGYCKGVGSTVGYEELKRAAAAADATTIAWVGFLKLWVQNCRCRRQSPEMDLAVQASSPGDGRRQMEI